MERLRPTRDRGGLAGSLVVAFLTLWMATSGGGGDPGADPGTGEAMDAEGAGRGAVQAVLDPDTGLPTTDPEVIRRVLEASGPPRDSLQLRRFSHQGLFEETLPSGFVAVDLQGRFGVPLWVELDADLADAGDVAESGEPGASP